MIMPNLWIFNILFPYIFHNNFSIHVAVLSQRGKTSSPLFVSKNGSVTQTHLKWNRWSLYIQDRHNSDADQGAQNLELLV